MHTFKKNDLIHRTCYDFVGMKRHQDRMSNGFRLFGKYYEGLWD